MTDTKIDSASFRRQYTRKYDHDDRCTTDVLALCDGIDALRAENERLKAELVTEHDIRVDTDHAMLAKEAEIERLRAALAKIAGMGHVSIDWALQVARDALGHDKRA